MSTLNESSRTFLANTTITAFRAVVLSTNGGVTLNVAATKPDGFAITDAASGDYVGVRFHQAPGTQKGYSAVSVVAVGDVLYAAAAGGVSTTGTIVVGKSLSANTVTGGIVEFVANTL